MSADTTPDAVQTATAAILALAGALTLWRLVRGPSVLDRSVALDALTSICLIAVALVACVQRSGALLPVLLVVSLVGFTGSVTVARFAAGRDGREVSAEDDSAGPDPRPTPTPPPPPPLSPLPPSSSDPSPASGGSP
jgi:multicomponent Na+:H+ antiporter subunit F